MIHIIHAFIITFILFSANIFRKSVEYPHLDTDKQDDAVNIDNYFLKLVANPQKRLLSSLMYTQTLLTADHDHYKGEDGKNWLFLRFFSILNLDPMFYEASLYGGMYTSIIKNDPIYGLKLYDIGLNSKPKDFWLNYYSGFIYLYDLKKIQEALEHYKRILGTDDQIKNAPHLSLTVLKLAEGNHISKEEIIELIKPTISKYEKNKYIREKLIEKLGQ